MALTPLPPIAGGVRSAVPDLWTPIVHDETRMVVVLSGKADVSIRPSLSDALCRLIADRSGDVVIDLSTSTFIDTAIVRALATAGQLLGGQSRRLTFRSPQTLVARVPDRFGLTDLIEAETGFRAGPPTKRP